MISKPDVNISLVSANNVLDIGTRRDLIVCQSPNATANVLITGVHSKTQAELDALVGTGSYCRFMIQAWLDANRTGNNVETELDLIALKPEAAAVASAIVLTITGTATEAGTITLSILSSELFKKTIDVASGDVHTVVATAIETAYTGVVAPFAVVDAIGTLTITASDKGTIGNDYGIEITGVPAGITATITPAASGATAPIITDVMDLVGQRRYQGIVWPTDLLSSAATELIDFLDDRFNVSNDILDGVAFIGETATLADAKAVATAKNSASLVFIGNNIAAVAGTPTKDGPEVLHPVDWITTTFMAVRSRRLSEGASISSVVSNNASGDQFGGKALASLPYFNTPMDGIPVTDSVSVFTGSEQAELNTVGYSVVGPNKQGTDTIMGAVVTTYKTDAAGNTDVSFKYLNYVDTASICREYLFNNMKSLFAQSRLTDGDLLPSRSMENAASLKAAFKGLLADLKEVALVRLGRVADKLIDDNMYVSLDLAGRSATINSVLPIVTQLETINVPLQLTFEL